MRVLALITARGGSKALPGKNQRSFHGHPLIAWSIRHAIESKKINDVIVSTDDINLANISESYGAQIPFIRPHSLAADNSTSVDVAIHALNQMENKGKYFDVLVLLQPTSPIRRSVDLDNMLDQFEKNWETAKGIVTTCPMKPLPSQGLLIRDGYVSFYEDFKPKIRQELEIVYSSFGVAWAIKTEVLKKEKTFYPDSLLSFPISKVQAVDIDDEVDFICAEALFSSAIKLSQEFMPSFKVGKDV